jgi:hypothetical protein
VSTSMTCGPCGTVITAADEDQLVARVQAHARDHDGTPELSREHILATFAENTPTSHKHQPRTPSSRSRRTSA